MWAILMFVTGLLYTGECCRLILIRLNRLFLVTGLRQKRINLWKRLFWPKWWNLWALLHRYLKRNLKNCSRNRWLRPRYAFFYIGNQPGRRGRVSSTPSRAQIWTQTCSKYSAASTAAASAAPSSSPTAAQAQGRKLAGLALIMIPQHSSL